MTRVWLTIFALILLMMGETDNSSALLIIGAGQAPTAAAGLAQIGLYNYGGGATPTVWVTPMFGLGFHKGDIINGCSGGAPIFKLGATVITFSESTQPSCWSDGSLKFASFMLLMPSSLAATSGEQLSMFGGGSFPAASSRSPNDFNPASVGGGNCDINNQVVGLDNISSTGVWKADLWTGVQTNGADYTYMDGAAGAVYRIRAPYSNSTLSQTSGFMEDWYYVASLQDNLGHYYGMRWLGRTTIPYYNASAGYAGENYEFFSFSTYQDFDGVTQLMDLWAGHNSAVTLTYTSGNTAAMSSNNDVWEGGNLVRLAGSVPTGVTAGTSYWISNQPVAPFGVNVSFGNATNVAGTQPLSGTGTTFTGTSFPYVTVFGSLYDAAGYGVGSNANNGQPYWNYKECGGSGPLTDVQVQVQLPNTYVRSSGLIPAYSLTSNFPATPGTGTSAQKITAHGFQSWSFWPMTAGLMDRDFETTGERADIGIMHAWAAAYWFNINTGTGDLNDERMTRIVGLGAGNWSINVRDHVTRTLPTLNFGHNNSGTNYTGMVGITAGNQTTSFTSIFRWIPDTSPYGTGFTLPTNNKTYLAGYNTFNTSHMGNVFGSAFIMTGEPQFMDMALEMGNEAILERTGTGGTITPAIVSTTVASIAGTNAANTRNFSVNGTVYYGATLNGLNELRLDAWGHNFVATAAMINDPGNASSHTYFNDIESSFAGAANAYVNCFNGGNCGGGGAYTNLWVYNNGLYNEGEQQLTPWSYNYLINSTAFGYMYTENANDFTFLSYMMKWPNYIDGLVGGQFVAAYAEMVRPPPNGITGQFWTSAQDANSQWQLTFAAFNFNPNANTTFSGPTGAGNHYFGGYASYTPTNGDEVMFCSAGGGGCQNNPPASFTVSTPYYMFNVSGSTWNLGAFVAGGSGCNASAQTGCTAISTTTTACGAPACAWFIYPTTQIPTIASCSGIQICSITTAVGQDDTGYNSIAYGSYMEAQAVYNFVNNTPGGTGFDTTGHLFTDLATILQHDGNFPTGYTSSTGYPKYAIQNGF